MSVVINSPSVDFNTRVVRGLVPKHSIVHKFGSATLTTSITPFTASNTYKTPIAATALEFVSASANDTAAGTGAQQITVIGLDANWAEVTQTVETNGTTAVALGTNLIRLTNWYVSRSGTYATDAAGSHAGILTIRVASAGATWSTIAVTPFAIGQSQIGCHTIPTGYTGYLLSKSITVDASKSTDIYFFQRPLANDVTTPFTGAMKMVEREVGLTAGFEKVFSVPKGPFVGPCDVGFMGLVSATTGIASVEFELLLIQD